MKKEELQQKAEKLRLKVLDAIETRPKDKQNTKLLLEEYKVLLKEGDVHDGYFEEVWKMENKDSETILNGM